MSDYLVDHAKQHAWCTPDQDRQFIFKPAKISPQAGIFNRVTVLEESINLPNATDRFHVYQIGQVPPDLLNVVGDVNTWRPISRVCRELNLLVDLYATNGLQFPRFAAWLLITLDKNIVIAVKDIQTLGVSLRTQDLYVRMYSNAYFGSPYDADDGHADGIYVGGKILANSGDVIAMQTAFAQSQAKVGLTYGFINGYYVDTLSVTNMTIGDVVEYVWDSTIYKTFDYVVSSLSTFNSTLDSKQKFLLHSADYTSDTIEFEDDIDFFVFKRLTNTTAKGLTFHKNAVDAVRSITHIDYSIPATYVQSYVDNGNGLFTNINDVTIRMHVRRSGWRRTLIDEAQRIKDLYRLPAVDIKNTLLGINSSFSMWSAASLENGYYAKIMRSYEQYIDLPLTVHMYGYNAMSRIIAATPNVLELDTNGNMHTDLPVGLQINSTIYEYDSDGILLGYNIHNAGAVYYATNLNCAFIEALSGKGSILSGNYHDVPNLTLEDGVEYRFYKSSKSIGGEPTTWVPAVLGSDYTIVNKVATWSLSSSVWFTLIREDAQWITYDLETDNQDPVYRFSINANGVFGGTIQTRPVQVPYGELDIWINGRSLVKDIDYFVNWPEVCIVTCRYTIGSINDAQIITVRARGFEDSITIPEVGFVKNGLLSRNGRYNVRDDKVMRIVADGRALLKEDLEFAEDGTLTTSDPLNGTAYSISDIRVFLGKYLPFTGSDATIKSSHALRLAAVEIDNSVSDYLTLKIPEQPLTGNSIGIDRYSLYSPFCARIALDIIAGNITNEFALSDPTDPQVRAAMVNYEFLLQYDPCLREDTNFDVVSIHPHPYTTSIPINFAGYKLLQKVIRIYLRNKVSLTGFFTIS